MRSEAFPSVPAVSSPQPADEGYLFEAFISYRHTARDRGWAKWLHSALESYRVPEALVRRTGLRARLGRVFRDEEELSASASLSEDIEQALRASRHLIVVCSRVTPASRWVNEEVLRFRQLGREQRIRALLVDGEPHESFPPALYQLLGEGTGERSAAGDPTASPADEPLAADVRPQEGESARVTRRLALLRLAASLLGCRFDDLRQRESERALRRLRRTVAAAMAAVALLGALAAVAVVQRNRATQRLEEMLTERGREEWLAGRAARAMPFLANAYEVDPESPAVRLLMAQALVRVVPRLSLSSGTREPAGGFVASQDGARLTIISRGRTSVWDLAGPRLVSVLGHEAFADASGDGLRILTEHSSGTLGLWDAVNGHQIARIGPVAPGLRQARLSGDAARLVTVHGDGLVETWDTATGRRMHAWRPHPEPPEPWQNKPAPVQDAHFSPNGQRIVTVGFDGMVRVWESGAGALITSIAARELVWRPRSRDGYKRGAVSWARLSPDGTLLMTLALAGTASVWDAATGRYLSAIKVHLPPGVPTTYGTPDPDITSLEFSRDGRSLLVTTDEFFHLWDVRGRTAGAPRPLGKFEHASLSHSGTRVVTAGEEGVQVWDIETGRRIAHIESGSRSASFSPDDKSIISVGSDGTVKVWPLEWVGPLVLVAHKGPIGSVEFSRDSRRVITGSADKTAKVWDVDSGTLVTTVALHDEEVVAATFNPDASLVLTAGIDGAATLTHIQSVVRKGDLVPPEGGPDLSAARFLPGGRQIVSIGRDKGIRVWDPSTAAQQFQLPGKAVTCWPATGFSPDGRLAITTEGGRARIWNTSDGILVSTLPVESPSCAAFSQDGRRLLTAGGRVGTPTRIWDVEATRVVSSFEESEGGYWLVAFSADNQVVAMATGQKGVTLRDVGTGRILMELDTQRRAEAMTFCRNGRFLLTAGERGAKLWDSAQGRLLAVFAEHTTSLSAAISPDDTRLVTAGADARAMIWRIALESRTPSEVHRLMRCFVPWRLQNGALVPHANAPVECSERPIAAPGS